ncbi:putative integral membrane protein [Babesia bovis T2Bo]|uniref:putative integral membrane protein n=1 Tax=Babesia bovis T2Bo TaxID=484906 RepID=UPI001C356B15|nr:putative integral membrane protein [Babesia bovis T2Bo]KAG6440218.1 putative integral membrane protein [Babesia bovis T2Bo]
MNIDINVDKTPTIGECQTWNFTGHLQYIEMMDISLLLFLTKSMHIRTTNAVNMTTMRLSMFILGTRSNEITNAKFTIYHRFWLVLLWVVVQMVPATIINIIKPASIGDVEHIPYIRALACADYSQDVSRCDVPQKVN